jgi:hypothetical protein
MSLLETAQELVTSFKAALENVVQYVASLLPNAGLKQELEDAKAANDLLTKALAEGRDQLIAFIPPAPVVDTVDQPIA